MSTKMSLHSTKQKRKRSDSIKNGKINTSHLKTDPGPMDSQSAHRPTTDTRRWPDVARRALSHNEPPTQPDNFLRVIRSGSRRIFPILRRKLGEAASEWIVEFIRADGLAALLDSLQVEFAGKKDSVAAAVTLLECVLCVRKVMESKIGLDYIVENKEYTHKLAAALDTNNVTVKKQVFELLSALCMYNGEGYCRAVEALENYKELKNERYRMRVLIEELRSAQTTEYKTTVMGFINCLIINSPSIKDRLRMRNEFIGLKLLEVTNRLRKGELNEELTVQLDVFDDQRYADESQLTGPEGVDLNSPQDVFFAILRQVAETPQEIPFLSILQHLLRIDSKEAISDIVWDTAETLVHRATLLETKSDSHRLLRSPSHHSLTKKCQCSCARLDEGCATGRRRSIWDGSKTPVIMSPSIAIIPPFFSGGPGLPGPPGPPGLSSSATGHPAASDSAGSFRHKPDAPGPPPPMLPPPPPPPPPPCPPPPPPPPQPLAPCPPPPPPFLGPGKPPPISLTPSPPLMPATPEPEVPLPQQLTPKPKSKMRSLNWCKLPNQKVVGKQNIWALMAETHNVKDAGKVDFMELEDLFCQQQTPQQVNVSPKLGVDVVDGVERRRRETTEINLLDGKRSLNVNIFLKQFRTSNDEIISLIIEGSHEDIGAEKLRGLLKILPEPDEAEMLRTFDGDQNRLGKAEKFLLQLLGTTSYKLRIESMLLKEEFASQMGFLETTINAMILAGEDLKLNNSLKEVLFMVLIAGNFLNSGGYAGNAAGFKMTCLQKLTDIRANKPGMNLIHFVARQAQQKNESLLKFPHEMQYLEEASKTSIDQLKAEISSLDNRVEKIANQINSASIDIQDQMQNFLVFARQQLLVLQDDLIELENVRVSLAEFYCEDIHTFKLEECFKTFLGFCTKFKAAVVDNERRRQAEEKAEQRRKQREEQAVMRRKTSGEPRPTSMSGSESETNVMDTLLTDIRNGFAQRRDSGSFKWRRGKRNSFENPNGNATSEDEPSITNSPRVIRRRIGSMGSGGLAPADTENSPDVTPNGTVRLRRNRNRSGEDDDNLLDFLRGSSAENEGRDRNSWGSNDGYGSLDRSSIRRSRRKRTDLLSGEFERERPASPAPSAELQQAEPVEEVAKPKQWRQKIEAWLQENEREEEKAKQLQDRRMRERNNKNECDNGKEVESKQNGFMLGTLHEDKADVQNYHPIAANPLKSTIDGNDVEKVLGVLEDVDELARDKSQWRKSSLNSSTVNEMRAKRGRVLESPQTPGSKDIHPLANIAKQSTSNSNSNRNNPIDDASAKSDKKGVSKSIVKITGNSLPISKPDGDYKLSLSVPQQIAPESKGDIDSENVETPPTPRRVRKFRNSLDASDMSAPSTPTEVKTEPMLSANGINQKKEEVEVENVFADALPSRKTTKPTGQEPLKAQEDSKTSSVPVDEDGMGLGQFDRFAAMRRTRRFRRPVEGEITAKGSKSTESVCEQGADQGKPSKSRREYSKEIPSENQETKSLPHKNSTTDIDKVLKEIDSTGKELQELGLAKGDRHPIANNIPSSTTRRPMSLVLAKRKPTEVLPPEEKTFRSTYVLSPTSPLSPTSELSQPKRIVRCSSITEATARSNETESNLPKVQQSIPDNPNVTNRQTPAFRNSLRIKKSHNSPEQTDTEPEKDEGFEETQSLISASSTQTCDADPVDTSQQYKASKKQVPTLAVSEIEELVPQNSNVPQSQTNSQRVAGSRLPTRTKTNLTPSRNPLGLTRQLSTPVRAKPRDSSNGLRPFASGNSVREPGISLSNNRYPSSRSSSRSSLASSIATVVPTRGQRSPSSASLVSGGNAPTVKNKITGYTTAIKALTKNLRKSNKTQEESKSAIPKISISNLQTYKPTNGSIPVVPGDSRYKVETAKCNTKTRSPTVPGTLAVQPQRKPVERSRSLLSQTPVSYSKRNGETLPANGTRSFMRATTASQAKVPKTMERSLSSRRSPGKSLPK